MLEKTIAALHAVESAIQEEYEDVKGWHAQARGGLEEAYTFVTGLRTKLEGIEPPAVAEATEASPPTTSTDGGESAPSTEGEAGAAAEPTDAVTEPGDGG